MPDVQEQRCDITICYPPGSSKIDGVLNRNHDIARSVMGNATLVDKRYGRNEALAWVERFFVRHRLNDWKVLEWMNPRI